MKTRFLFPAKFRILGWLIFIPSLAAAAILIFSDYNLDNYLQSSVFAIINSDILAKPQYLTVIKNGIGDEILLVLILIGGLLAGFSKLKNEDELTSQIRYESLVWAAYFNFAVMLVATLFIYGLYFLNVMMLNMFSLLFFFIIRFYVMLYRLKKSVDEE